MIDDVLSDLLRSVRLSGAIFFDVDVAAPWVAAAPPSRSIADSVIPGADHVIEYHVIVEGQCWARLADRSEQVIPLSAGSIVTFPQGDPHILSSAPDLQAEPDLDTFDQAARARSLPLNIDYRGDGPQYAHIICGFLGCDIAPFNPLIPSLPKVIHVPDGYGSGGALLDLLIRATVRETANKSAGSSGVLAKLSELIFVEVLRHHAATLSAEAGGWLAALRDPGVGRAMGLLHAEPARNWTVADLARAAGLSRTVLAERFTARLGMPPMAYLAKWRMQRAAELLKDGPMPIGLVAEQVGYASEAAFSRAFKRAAGLAPAQWRTGPGGRDSRGGVT